MKKVWMLFNICGLLLCAAINGKTFAQDDWKADIEKTDYDPNLIHQRTHSPINWNQDPSNWLNITKWMAERKLKDEQPGWKVRHRISAIPEKMGKVLSCIGSCKLFRGTTPHHIRYGSQVIEGDEIQTDKNSYLWVYLIDGSLIRLAPETSVGFLEINFQPKKVFHNIRLNQGYIHWLHRSPREQKLTSTTDTDALFLPLVLKEANLSWFQRLLYKKAPDINQILMTTSSDYLGLKEHQAELNKMIRLNNASKKDMNSEVLFVAPNGSLHLKNTSFSWYYGTAEDSYFKTYTRNTEEEGESREERFSKFLYRGYVNSTEKDIEPDLWMRVDRNGRQCDILTFNVPQLLSSEIPYRRPTTILLAREIWLNQEIKLWSDLSSEEKLADNWGLKLWGDDLAKRLDFLKSYSRRIETTNLRSVQKLTESLILSEEAVKALFDERYFTHSLEAYYKSVKERHSVSRDSVRDMSDLHYYGWILKNARQY